MIQDKGPKASNGADLEKVLVDAELTSHNNSLRLDQLENKIKSYEQSLNELHLNVTDLSAKTQATADFSDDLVSSSSALIESVESRVDKTLDITDQVLTHADALISTYLVIISIFIAIVGTAGSLWIQHRMAKTREEYLKDAVKDLTIKLRDQRDFRDDFINALVTHKFLSENINTAIDNAVKDRVNSMTRNSKGNFKADVETTGD
ncbi:hypothetical protein JG626_10520 [Vibrio cholerae]|uniref:hypothetical protein n=1 Tax=Vibrio cholerae TaxID=666 RepID=UPI0018F103D4|nr:hypothetical protein [Vibrio cholerae]MBJ6932842.1 hypothetical protein [Vibrio cholerae]HDL9480098.1 hypothetical protein [Vibrio cholerae]